MTMWVHLLSLGLIDGAGGEAPPVPDNADTHDGYFHNLWRKLKEKPESKVEELAERIEEIEAQIAEVKARPLPVKPVYLQSVPIPPIEAQARLLEALILESARLRQELEDEEEAEILLLL